MNLIISTLKKYPNKNISQVARILRVDESVVSLAQRDYLKPFLKRNSPLWNSQSYGKGSKAEKGF